MTLTPAQNGFLKQLVMVVIMAIVAFAANAANLSPVLGGTAALIISALASSIESHIKANTGNGLFGAVRIS